MPSESKKNLEVRIIRDSAVWSYMPDPTNLVKGSIRGLHTYDDMRLDARVGSLFDDRRNATHNLPALVSSVEDARVQAYAERFLDVAEIRKWGFVLLDGALTYGFQPAEIVWRREDGLLVIDGLDCHDIRRYRFDGEGRMYYDAMLLDQPYKWIVHRNEGDRYNRPYGRAYLKRVYWPWKFKQAGWRFWLTAAEKFSVPSLVAMFDQSDPDKARVTAQDLADLIIQIGSGSAGALANVKGLQQIGMAGSVSDFDSLIRACDLQIAYGMTGQALATNVSDTGTQALGTVQERTKQGAYENDARALAYTLNRLIGMAIEVNFGNGAEAPRFSFDTEDYASFQEVMQALGSGVPISRSAMYSRYGLPEPEDDDDVLDRPQAQGSYMGGAFNFSDDEGKKKVHLPMMVIRR